MPKTHSGKRNTKTYKSRSNLGVSLYSNDGDGKNVYIPMIWYYNLKPDYYKKTVCVKGYIHSIGINKDHAYINLTPKIEGCVKISLSSRFIHMNNENKKVFDNLQAIFNALKICKRTGQKIVCCCVGEVLKGKNGKGYNISPDRWKGFQFDGLYFFDFIAKYSK